MKDKPHWETIFATHPANEGIYIIQNVLERNTHRPTQQINKKKTNYQLEK